jgi:hypothetical protein
MYIHIYIYICIYKFIGMKKEARTAAEGLAEKLDAGKKVIYIYLHLLLFVY